MMSKTELEFKASVVYRIWRSVQVRLKRADVMPENYRILKPCWKKPFQSVAKLRIPAIIAAWNERSDKIKAMHSSAYKEFGLSAQSAIGRSRGS
jgi:hypothetical protein